MQRSSFPPWQWPRSAYVHIPFCAHHCGYCDFAVVAGRDNQIRSYFKALEIELSLVRVPQPVETLFLGGGTPTHPEPEDLAALLGAVTSWFPLESGGEFSVEANPDTLSEEKVAVLRQFGVNRVSLGAQSFRAETLEILERSHRAEQIARSVAAIRSAGMDVSLDLIFGVPGQTLDDWRMDMQRALDLGPDHISTYGLTYEKGTKFWKARRSSKMLPIGEDEERAMYALAMDVLTGAGLEHYEISNFARPGKRCRHNEVYWANHAYFGAGLGAARYVQGRRELNTRSFDEYLHRLLSGKSPTTHSEELEPIPRARETMVIQLRRSEGIQRGSFLVQTGFELDDLAGARMATYLDLGLLADHASSVTLTREGKFVADAVIAGLLA